MNWTVQSKLLPDLISCGQISSGVPQHTDPYKKEHASHTVQTRPTPVLLNPHFNTLQLMLKAYDKRMILKLTVSSHLP